MIPGVGNTMANQCEEQELETLPTGVFELSGEPAIVINGVPDVPSNANSLVLCDTISDTGSLQGTVFGEWMEGREVQKLFGEQFYTGTVTMFDKESGWYRVEYEDGDFEDLEWHELEEVLVPLDVSVPLKSLALKIIGKNQRPIQNSGKMVPKYGNRRGRKAVGVGKTVQLIEVATQLEFNSDHYESGTKDMVNGFQEVQDQLSIQESNWSEGLNYRG